ncbi:hypothetical protein LTR84_006557 [Exophiala bonariae]|uniref:Transcription factor domain-containing protein n=1 Tax=Exophiala bonariae TaxID=1690606 RepID=A0AAV9N120_9EURO|nr:hypothetical protein LTR84_006557 [Exophiala bonariae]
MYRDLRLGEDRKDSKPSTPSSARLRRSTRTTTWAIFNYSSIYSLNFLKLPPVEPPSIGLPYDEHEIAETDQWSPYPEHGQVTFHWNLMYNKLCELAMICWKISKLLFSSRSKDDMNSSRAAAEAIGEELVIWRTQLPFELRRHSGMAPPIMEVHAISYYASITLMEFLKKPEVVPPSTPTNIEFVNKQDQRTILCVMEVYTLIEIFSKAYTTARPAPSLFQGASVGAFTLIKSLDTPENVPVFTQFCKFVIAGAKHHVLWRGIAGMIRLTAERVGVTLPSALDQELLDVTKGIFHSEDRKTLNNSQYPSYTLAKDMMREDDFTLGELLDKWDSLEIEATNDEGS